MITFISKADLSARLLLTLYLFAIGMLMIYSFFRLFTMTAKSSPLSALKILLPLSFCALLLGCDSHSSTPTAEKRLVAATTNESTQSDSVNPEQNNIGDSSTADSSNAVESQSLITAAKSDRKSSSSLLDAVELTTNSKMQATLIGDYTGIMPCGFCDSTQVLLNLFADSSVIKTSTYNNPQKPTASLTENGIYRQDNDIITIVYDDQRIESYLIQSNHLVLLDDDKIADADYTLSRK